LRLGCRGVGERRASARHRTPGEGQASPDGQGAARDGWHVPGTSFSLTSVTSSARRGEGRTGQCAGRASEVLAGHRWRRPAPDPGGSFVAGQAAHAWLPPGEDGVSMRTCRRPHGDGRRSQGEGYPAACGIRERRKRPGVSRAVGFVSCPGISGDGDGAPGPFSWWSRSRPGWGPRRCRRPPGP